MVLLKYLIASFFISAAGTIPIGLITLTIAQTTIEKGRKSGILVALGASIPEFIYTFIALKGLEFFAGESMIQQYIQKVSIVLFFILGLYYFFKKVGETTIKNESTSRDFVKGIAVGIMNFLIIPFWLIIGAWLESQGFIFENTFFIISFSIGAAMGAFVIFYIYIILAETVLKKSKKINFYANKIIGVLFLGLAIFQLL